MHFIKTILASSMIVSPLILSPVYAANASSVFDIDGNNQTEALSDGLLLLRYLFGFNGTNLTNGAVGANATRSNATQIIDYIENPPSIGLTIRALNDTGITDSTPTGTDGTSGRDFTDNDDSDGHAGFSFTKLSDTGVELPALANTWACVKDNVTGLIWEAKIPGTIHDPNDTYTWLDPIVSTNGGNSGTAAFNDTYSFVSRVNTANTCGASDWRMPTVGELMSIADYGKVSPAIDTTFFPNTISDYYWSSTTYAPGIASAWAVTFTFGVDEAVAKHLSLRVRLVRSAQ